MEQGFFHVSAFFNHDVKDIGLGVYEGLILETRAGASGVGGLSTTRFGSSQTVGGHFDIDQRYGIFGSLKRGAITLVQEAGVAGRR